VGVVELSLAGLFMSAIGTMQQVSAANKANKLAARQAEDQRDAEIAELQRQREERNLIADEEKSDRVREADAQFASMVTSMAETGGAGTQNEYRFAAAIGGSEGLDLARIESNRQSSSETLASSQRASDARARDRITEGNLKTRAGNTARIINLAGDAVSTGLSIRQYEDRKKMTEQRGVA
jgi:hypothetical protein